MSIQICHKSDCCGCTACVSVCNHQAIKMQEDLKGFKYPTVDHNRCIECGLCERVCQFHKNYDRYDNYEVSEYFAIRCNDRDELSKSQSGGAFYLFSEIILQQCGIIYGVVYGTMFKIEHIRSSTPEGRNSMRGSKYVQSDLYDLFLQVRTDLKNQRKVLFSGTPCQVAGLRSFVGKRLSVNLITIDLLCHGVASPRFWFEYLKVLEKKIGQKLLKVNMRDKTYGWLSSEETYTFERKKIRKNTFYSLYYKNLIIRESCFNCPYSNCKRVGDISIGDYQGWNNTHKEFNDNTGISLVLVNSDKGKELLNTVKNNYNIFSQVSSFEDCVQLALQRSAEKPILYEEFWQVFRSKGCLNACKKFGDMSFKTQTVIHISSLYSRFQSLFKL